MTEEIQALYEETEKLGSRILDECQSFLVELSGSQKDIDNGTLIRIPMGAGYVKFSKSAESWKLNCWINEELFEKKVPMSN